MRNSVPRKTGPLRLLLLSYPEYSEAHLSISHFLPLKGRKMSFGVRRVEAYLYLSLSILPQI
jgi:hypothetical protein